jgi:glycine C-acetyltransferase
MRPPSLPHPISTFVGRADQRARLVGLLADQVVCLVYGVAGIGKTELCYRVAADVRATGPLAGAPALLWRATAGAGLDEAIAGLRSGPRRDGAADDLEQLVAELEARPTLLMIDDAHTSGVLGRNGRGTVDHFNLHGRVDIQVGTLSKAIGVLEGYVCGRRELIEFLYHRARPFLFSTSHPPAVAASCLAAFDILEHEPERIESLWSNTRFFKSALNAAGFRTGESETPITPIMVGEAKTAHAFSRALFEEGVFATGIGYPTVPEGKARIRTIMTATHTREQLDRALEILARVARKMGILG